jgi:hypothetical protein
MQASGGKEACTHLTTLYHGLFENNLIEWCKQFCEKDKVMLDIAIRLALALKISDTLIGLCFNT